MKREDIKALIPAITDEQLDKVMNLNGEDLTRESAKTADLQSKLNAANTQLKTAQDGLKAFEGADVNELKGQVTKLQGDLTAQAEAFRFDALLDGAIRDAKAHSVKAVRGMLDIDTLRGSKDQTADVKAALEALRKDNAWAFEVSANPAAGQGDKNKDPSAASGGAAGVQTVNTGAEQGAGGNNEKTLSDEITAAIFGKTN